jgi:hypothetical protein
MRGAAVKIEALLISVALLGACVPAEDEAQAPVAPDPIGDELLSFTTALGVPGCGEAHLYRARRLVQYQCFATDGSFSWENHGTLSADGEATLDAALAAVDLTNTNPGDDKGFCNGPESGSATLTLWIDQESFSYSPACPTEGIQALHDAAVMLVNDIGDCTELDLLESVEPGCRAY